jgi:hypothetical protein
MGLLLSLLSLPIPAIPISFIPKISVIPAKMLAFPWHDGGEGSRRPTKRLRGLAQPSLPSLANINQLEISNTISKKLLFFSNKRGNKEKRGYILICLTGRQWSDF